MEPLEITANDDEEEEDDSTGGDDVADWEEMRAPRLPVILLLSSLIFPFIESMCSLIVRRESFAAKRWPSPGHFDCMVQISTIFLSLVAEKISTGRVVESIRRNVIDNPIDALKMLAPALLYSIGDLMFYVSWHNIPIKFAYMSPSLGIIVLAAMSAVLLDRHYSVRQWACILGAVAGLCLVIMSGTPRFDQEMSQSASVILAMVCTVMSWLLYSIGKLYLEKLLKGHTDAEEEEEDDDDDGLVSLTNPSTGTPRPAVPAPTSLWIRITEFAFFSIFLLWVQDWIQNQSPIVPDPVPVFLEIPKQHKSEWFFYGFTPKVWVSVFIHSIGVILNIATIRYVDAVLTEYSHKAGVGFYRFFAILVFARFFVNFYELTAGIGLFALSAWYYFQQHNWYQAM